MRAIRSRRFLCSLLSAIMLLSMVTMLAPAAIELDAEAVPQTASVTVAPVDGEAAIADGDESGEPVIASDELTIAPFAEAVGNWDLPLENWKIAPESAITLDPWKTAGVGDAKARNYDTASWIAAKAPGTVLGALIDAGKYVELFDPNNSGEKDVYFDINMQKIPRDDFDGWWWYSLDFNVPAGEIGKNFNLNLKQISYQGEVFINGTQVFNENLNITDVQELQNKAGTGTNVGAGSNPLPPYTFSDTGIGDANGRPTGRVAYTSMAEAGGQLSSVAQFGFGDFDKYKGMFIGTYRTYDVDITSLVQEGSNNIKIRVKRMFNVVDFGPFWHDWHPAAPDNNMGLNGKATLSATGIARIDDPLATSKVIANTITSAGNGTADLSLYVNVTNMSNAPMDAVINAVVKDPAGNVVPGLGSLTKTVTGIPARYYKWDVPVIEDFRIDNAQLWWTLGLGGQPLYTVDYTISVGGVVSDTLTHRFAIRELRHEYNNYANTNNAIAVQVFVNHQPIVMKGGGFSALDMFYRHDDLANRNFVEIVKTMGHNFWRDEGKFFSEDLYDLMDENGILLMTGFMCCDRNEATRGDNNTWDPSSWSQAERMIVYESLYSQMRIMRQHPVAWAFLNGSDHPKSQSGAVGSVSVERKMLEIAGRVRWHQVAFTLNNATYGNSSNLVGAGGGIGMSYGYDTLPPGQIFTAVNPADTGIASGTNLGMQGFISEGSGGMGIPVMETLNLMIPTANMWPYNQGHVGTGTGPGNYNKWNYHNARGDNFENLDVSNLWIENAYGASDSIEEYMIRAQMFQYDYQRANHEALNLRRFNKAMGFVNWMLNSPRPSAYWNQVDFYFNPHGVTYGTAKGNAPVHIMYDAYGRQVHVMNSTRQALEDVTATLKIYDINGNQINETLSDTFNLSADGVTQWLNPNAVTTRVNMFVPAEYNGTDWYQKAFTRFDNQYANAAQGRRAAGASGNYSPWNNAAITGSLIRPTTDVYFISLELKQGSEVLSRNDYAVSRKRDVIGNASAGDRYQMAQTSDMKQLNELPAVSLQLVQNAGALVDGGEMWQQTVAITNPTKDVAYGVELKAYKDANKKELTPANYSDNLLIIYPGETRIITIWHLAENLGGKDAYIGIDCYNNIINNKPARGGNRYVPGDPDSAAWTEWGLPAQTQTSATTNLAKNVGSTVATVASNSTAPNTAGTDANSRATRITNATFVTYANQRSRSVIDGSIADGASGNAGGTGFATIPPGSASYINLGSAKTFDHIVTYWTEDNNSSWGLAVTGRGVPNKVTVQISAATGGTADWNNLLYSGEVDNLKARSMNVDILLDKAYTARHIRIIPEGVTGAAASYGAANAPGRTTAWHGGWDAKSGRLNDHVPTRALRNQFSLSSVEIYNTYNNLYVDFIGEGTAKATVNGKTINATDPSVKRFAPVYFGAAVNVLIEVEDVEKVFVYLDSKDISGKTTSLGEGKYSVALDGLPKAAELSIYLDEPPVTDFFASFETSEAVQAYSNNVIASQNVTLASAPGAGPNATADPIYSRAWDGTRVLRVTGTQPAAGNAFSTNLIFDNLDILVTKNSQLSYVILPDYTGAASAAMNPTNWDWDFTSQYMAIDLEFSDGTRLSSLGGVDQYGHPMSGRGQGEARHLYQKQWNLVKSNLGDVAEGKTITKVLLNFDKPVNKNARDWSFGAYIDYLRIMQVDTSPRASLVEYANSLVGTSDRPLYSRGNQWPAIMTPNAFNVWAPSNQPNQNYLGGNHGEKIYTPIPQAGITHITTTHQASTWLGDFGTFQFMPNTNYDPTSTTFPAEANRRTMYDKDAMVANPSYLSIDFSDAANAPAKGVKLELSPTEHAAAVRFTFPADSTYVNVIFDSRRATTGGSMSFSGNSFTAVTAHNHGNNEGRTANMHIYGEFDVAPLSTRSYATTNARSMVTFPAGTTEVNMRLATSFISAEQAKKNLELEIAQGASFDTVKAATAKIWNDLLGTAVIEGASEEEMIAFYSNLFRTYADPLLLSENIGTAAEPIWGYASPYRGTSSTTRSTVVGDKLYYNNGFWDTFRGAWTTYGLLTPSHAGVMLDGLVQHYKDSNWLARWLAPSGRNSMVGTSSDIIFGDSVAKGIQDFDIENAYMASLKNASAFAPNATSTNATAPSSSYSGRAGMDEAPYIGYTHATDKGLSWSIDNYLNDFGVSLMAEKLGKTDEAIYFRNSAQHFVNLWNYSGGGWFIPRNNSGVWTWPNGLTYNTSGTDSAYRKQNPYEETNGFTTTFSGFADMHGLANLFGGKDKLAERLDRYFTDETLYGGIGRDMFVDFYDSKMGQYGHGNQPNFHIPYAYTYAGQPYKTQAITRDILDRIYVGASFDQLFPGDQDNGSTSGWAVMSALGFYPISNGTDGYIITSPLHDKTTLNLPTGKIEIILNNNSRQNVYIQSMTIDGVAYNESHISAKDLLASKVIVFEMGPEPSDWACDSTPPSITPADSTDVPNPLRDFTTRGVAIVEELPAATRMTEAAYATSITTASAANLFNNTNANNAVFTAANASVFYYFPNAKIVEMVTLTSASALGDSAPNSFTLYGSNDGSAWTAIHMRTGIAFNWARQLKPFAVDNDKAYKYYRLDLSAAANIQVSQVELLGYAIDIIGIQSELYIGQKSFEVITDNSIVNVWLRGSNLNRITSGITVSPASLNPDGTKTFKVAFSGEIPELFYVTACTTYHAGTTADFELTQSRKTVTIGDTHMYYVTFMADEDEFYELGVVDGEKAVPPSTNPVKKYFYFVSWTLDGNDFDFNTPITGPLTLLASWEYNPISALRIADEKGVAAASMVTIARNKSMAFKAIVDGEALPVGIVWSTSNSAFATVDANGIVTTKALAGTVTLTAKAPSGVTHSIILRIT